MATRISSISDAVCHVPHLPATGLRSARAAYYLRHKRRYMLWRAFRRRKQLSPVANRTAQISPTDILAFATVRNECLRLPYFLHHHRRLGVDHFLFVDNGSDDGTADFLAAQPDVSVWKTKASYRLSRFGMDWLTWLQIRYGHDHWCLTLDADELFIYPYHDTRSLHSLTEQLERIGTRSFGSLMLDLYPKGPVDQQVYNSGQDPTQILNWFDSGNYVVQKQEPAGNLWVQGGPRARMFFSKNPRSAPTLNKTPLIKWSRRYAYVSSTHSALPPRLNRVYDETGGERISGILLHTKFLHTVVARSLEEKQRRQHFGTPENFDDYYDQLATAPDFWTNQSTRYLGWRQLEAMGLMSRGGWV